MNIRKIVTLIFLLSSVLLNAQTDFRPGYIIINSGDTIYGDIDYRGNSKMGEICKFKSSGNESIIYTPNDIIAYRFIDGKYYVSKIVNGEYLFLEYLIKGEVNLYYMRNGVDEIYYLDKQDTPTIEITYEEGIKKIDNREVYYRSTKHFGILTYYMQDAPQLQNQIKNIKKPKRENLIKLAEDYHNLICEDGQCIIYERVQPKVKVNIDFVGGVLLFGENKEVVSKSNLLTGILLHFWMPNTNEKLYFKTGLMFSNIETTEGNDVYIKIPVHLGYLAPNTFKIRPFASIGLLSPSYSFGLMMNINKRINLGIQGWTNFYADKLPIIPSRLNNYSILGNIYIEL